MNIRNPIHILHILFIAIFVCLSPTESKAQSTVQMRCGNFNTEITSSQTISNFPGKYYYTSRLGYLEPEFQWEFGLITANGRQTFTAPFSPDLSRNITFPRISPDGTKMVFLPVSGTEIMVWDILSGETASLSLPQDIIDYLLRFEDGYSTLTFNKLVWIDASELSIQYYASYNTPLSIPTSRISMSVSQDPLNLTFKAGTDTAITQLTSNPTSLTLSLPSPDLRYRVDINDTSQSVIIDRAFQVIDPSNNQVVFEPVIAENERMFSEPIWSFDGNNLFYTLSTSPSGRLRLMEVKVNEGFRVDPTLDQLLDQYFGISSSVTSIFPPMISTDGTHLVFGYYHRDGTTDVYDILRYNILSGGLISVCDDIPTSNDWHPFWAPSSNRFAGYWHSGSVKVYDFETGNRYLLPGNSFVGWIP
jgi:Tol biopolymer transport system component